MPRRRRQVGGPGLGLPARLVAYFEGELIAAGRPVTLATFSTGLAALPILLGVLGALLSLRGQSSLPTTVALVLAMSTFGLAMPVIWLRGRLERRQMEITRALPDTFDLVVVSVEAGLGLEAASLGTLGLVHGDETASTGLTTPDTLTLHRVLHDLATRGASTASSTISRASAARRRCEG